jgi:hypothetical protein
MLNLLRSFALSLAALTEYEIPIVFRRKKPDLCDIAAGGVLVIGHLTRAKVASARDSLGLDRF